MRERELKLGRARLAAQGRPSLPMRERELKRAGAEVEASHDVGRSPCGSVN